jgi:hypothetical protein
MQRFGVIYHRRIKMKGNLSKKLLAMAMSTLFLASMGAIAAGKKCPTGQMYDTKTKQCVCPKGTEKDATTGECVKK